MAGVDVMLVNEFDLVGQGLLGLVEVRGRWAVEEKMPSVDRDRQMLRQCYRDVIKESAGTGRFTARISMQISSKAWYHVGLFYAPQSCRL